MAACLVRDRTGASAIEYGLLATLVGIAAIAGIEATGGAFGELLRSAADAIADAVTSAS